MQVQVDGNYVYEVEILVDGSWKFFFHHDGGFVREVYTYSKEYVETNLRSGAWEIVNVQQEFTPNYAAAFNMWLEDYMNNPQAYEDSHSSAVRHLKEKLNGEEPSYGAVCAEVLVNYLNKLESK